jgi:SAM-dependent methyltransferase
MIATTAATEGPEWSAKAPLWAELWAHLADPARAVVLEATAVGSGTRLLDVGCGSGELCTQAAARGATVSGIDAAEGMVEIARRRLPGADLRVGPMERLPWDDASFDVPYEVHDRAALERALLIDAEMIGAIDAVGEEEARRVVLEASARHRRLDGSYRFDNRFRYVIARA